MGGALGLTLAGLNAGAQTPDRPGAQTQRLQQQHLDAQNTAGVLANVPPAHPAPAVHGLARLPDETPCFPVRRLALVDNPFAWVPPFVRNAHARTELHAKLYRALNRNVMCTFGAQRHAGAVVHRRRWRKN